MLLVKHWSSCAGPLVLLALLSTAGSAQCLARLPTQRLTAPSPATGDLFGTSVAMTAAGDRILVGAPRTDGAGVDSGSVHVFARTSTGFVQETELLAPDGSMGDRFGESVAVTPDGSRAVVGAPRHTGAASSGGAVYVWTRSGSVWTQEEQFLGQQAFGLGVAVAISDAGDLVVAGAPGSGPQCDAVRLVRTYRRTGSSWSFGEDIQLGSAVMDIQGWYGSALALSQDGSRLFIGDYRFACGFLSTGALNVVDFTPAGWVLDYVLVGPSDWSTHLGRSVSALPAGDRMAIGVPNGLGYGLGTGEVLLYEDDPAAGWSETQRLTAAAPVAGNRFGRSVAWSADGSTILVGAVTDGDAAPDAGAVHVFRQSGTDWVEIEKIVLADGSAGDTLGEALAVSADGSAGVAGAIQRVGFAPPIGPGFAIVLEPLPLSTYCTAKITSNGCVPVIDSAGSPSTTGQGPFVITCRQVLNGKNGLYFYGLSGRAALPFLSGTLCALPPLQRTPIQSSGGTPPPAVDCSGAYAFDANAWFGSGQDPNLVAGSSMNGQFWFRDPSQPDGTGVGLSDAIELAFCD